MASSPTTLLESRPNPPTPDLSTAEWDWLALLLVIGFFTFIGACFFKAPLLPGDTLGLILGNVMGWISAIVFFKWGSSQGSKAKDAVVTKLIDR